MGPSCQGGKGGSAEASRWTLTGGSAIGSNHWHTIHGWLVDSFLTTTGADNNTIHGWLVDSFWTTTRGCSTPVRRRGDMSGMSGARTAGAKCVRRRGGKGSCGRVWRRGGNGSRGATRRVVPVVPWWQVVGRLAAMTTRCAPQPTRESDRGRWIAGGGGGLGGRWHGIPRRVAVGGGGGGRQGAGLGGGGLRGAGSAGARRGPGMSGGGACRGRCRGEAAQGCGGKLLGGSSRRFFKERRADRGASVV